MSGTISINRNGLRWREQSIFSPLMDGLASEAVVLKTVMIDAAYLNAHSTATGLRSKKGRQATIRGAV